MVSEAAQRPGNSIAEIKLNGLRQSRGCYRMGGIDVKPVVFIKADPFDENLSSPKLPILAVSMLNKISVAFGIVDQRAMAFAVPGFAAAAALQDGIIGRKFPGSVQAPAAGRNDAMTGRRPGCPAGRKRIIKPIAAAAKLRSFHKIAFYVFAAVYLINRKNHLRFADSLKSVITQLHAHAPA